MVEVNPPAPARSLKPAGPGVAQRLEGPPSSPLPFRQIRAACRILAGDSWSAAVRPVPLEAGGHCPRR